MGVRPRLLGLTINPASIVLPDGTTQELTTLNVRATEYSVGDSGPNAMPARACGGYHSLKGTTRLGEFFHWSLCFNSSIFKTTILNLT
ncbi:hypothetical protein ACFOU2_01605 [Bacillus songklensis]|uniref:Uncharacterized protein n=1 Tax=Bacillus songklensis TaxID=1069116 RepID=A0ABV8AX97_9BACI